MIRICFFVDFVEHHESLVSSFSSEHESFGNQGVGWHFKSQGVYNKFLWALAQMLSKTNCRLLACSGHKSIQTLYVLWIVVNVVSSLASW